MVLRSPLCSPPTLPCNLWNAVIVGSRQDRDPFCDTIQAESRRRSTVCRESNHTPVREGETSRGRRCDVCLDHGKEDGRPARCYFHSGLSLHNILLSFLLICPFSIIAWWTNIPIGGRSHLNLTPKSSMANSMTFLQSHCPLQHRLTEIFGRNPRTFLQVSETVQWTQQTPSTCHITPSSANTRWWTWGMCSALLEG